MSLSDASLGRLYLVTENLLQLFPRNVRTVLSYCTEIIIVTASSQDYDLQRDLKKLQQSLFTLLPNNCFP